MSLSFETRIAAAATAQEPRQMRQEFTRVLRVTAGEDSRKRHRLGFREVLYFRLKGALEEEGLQLTPDDRRDLYRVLTSKSGVSGGWKRGGRRLVRMGDVPVTFDLTGIVRSTYSALRVASQGEALVEQRADVCSGEPVFKGTRVPLAQVVEQFRADVPLEQIAEDYPQLEEPALQYARFCANLRQAPGRPNKTLTLRRTAIEAAD